MRSGEAQRAAMVLPLKQGDCVTVRNRRPGDRVQTLGAPGSRRLKEVLIDRKMAPQERDRLPLLVVGGRIAWVPGVTIAQECRLSDESEVWVAEIEPA